MEHGHHTYSESSFNKFLLSCSRSTQSWRGSMTHTCKFPHSKLHFLKISQTHLHHKNQDFLNKCPFVIIWIGSYCFLHPAVLWVIIYSLPFCRGSGVNDWHFALSLSEYYGKYSYFEWDYSWATQQKKQNGIIFKINFEKAYDKVN